MNNIKDYLYYKYLFHKAFKLSKDNQITFIKDYISEKYHIVDFPSTFYESLLIIIKQSNKILNTIISENDIYKVIELIKNTPHLPNISDYINPSTYYQIPEKHINLIITKLHCLSNLNTLDNILEHETQYYLSRKPTFREEEYYIIAYQMYQLLGYNNSLDILNHYYGNISYTSMHFLFYSLKLNNNNDNHYFIDFLFKNKKDPQNIMRLIISGKTKLIPLNFSYLQQNFNKLIELHGSNITKNQVEDFLKTRFVSSLPFHPEVSPDIIKDIIPSYLEKNHSKEVTEATINKETIHFYEEYILYNNTSSIPQGTYSYNDLQCTILPKNSPELLVIGYRNNNCLRLNGEAFLLYRKAIKSKHMRILKIENSNKETIAMMLVIRNGNTLVGQGIEISKHNKENPALIYQACKYTLKEIMNTMNASDDEIVATIIGNSNVYTKMFQINTLPFRVTPVVEGNIFQEYYDGFNHYQTLLDLKDGKKISDIKLYIPNKEYYDPREEILHTYKTDFDDYNSLLINKRLFAISALANTQKRRIEKQLKLPIKEVYCNTDWYIIVFINDEIDGAYLEYDPRAKEEYLDCLSQLTKKDMTKKLFNKQNKIG